MIKNYENPYSQKKIDPTAKVGDTVKIVCESYGHTAETTGVLWEMDGARYVGSTCVGNNDSYGSYYPTVKSVEIIKKAMEAKERFILSLSEYLGEAFTKSDESVIEDLLEDYYQQRMNKS